MKKIIFPFLFVFPLASCESQSIEKKYYFFNTAINLTLYQKDKVADDKAPITPLIQERLSALNDASDNYSETNTLFKINKEPGEYVINQDLYELLKRSKELEEATNGYFNPLVGSLSKKWKDSLSHKQILPESVINEEINKINTSSYTLKEEENTFKVTKIGEAEIDFGAMVKGFALDYCKNLLIGQGITKYIIDAGHSSILLGEKSTKDGLFKVGLLDVPNAYLTMKNCFIGASGVSEQGVKIDDKMYSHIVNPFTGSVINKYDMTFVKGDNGALCDALSTAFMLMDIEQIKEMEKKYNVQSLIYKDGNFVYKNDGLEVKYH